MNINELNSFDLSAAVKFHDRLNPGVWGRDEHLLPEVQSQLLKIAADFQEFLGVSDLALQDITISGSNAAYSYTPDSDIDLHLVVDMPADNSEVYQELFNAKKYQYNDEHDIRIGGADVELYVQPADQPHVSQGIYSVQDQKWLQVPRRIKADLDDHCVQHKVEDLAARIDAAVESGDKAVMQRLWDKIKTMRQTGLEQSGEFGCDNLVFKMLRRSGHLERLKKAKTAAHDKELSLQERKRKKQRVQYGFGGWWYPGFGYAGDSGESGGDGGGESVREGHYGSSLSSEDGVAPSTAMFVTEDDRESVIQQFIKHTAQRLGIETLPQIELHNDDEWSRSAHSFGRYEPDSHVLHVNLQGRHIMDILRTTAHELAHCRQHELKGIDVNDGATGSPVENEAHAVAGIIMRDWADRHPELFADLELTENASGYIPKNRREAAMPQYAMALSVDIKPGQVGKEANKLGLKTGRNGEPQLLMKSANLREGRMPQQSMTEEDELVESLRQEFELLEDEFISEIKMSPTNLRAEAAKTGAIAGMEFEMIVPGIDRDSSNDEFEADYDFDERCRSIDDAVRFFNDGDWNGRREVAALREKMEDDFQEWLTTRIDQDWNRDGEYFVRDWLGAFVSDSEWRDKVDDNTSEQEAFEKFVSEVYGDPNNDYYQSALDEYRDDKYGDYDEGDWLRAEGLGLMSNIEDAYQITWPHWSSPNQGNDSVDTQMVADEFSQAVGREVRVNTRYHQSGARPGPDNQFYVVEPDGSLEGNNDGDEGLEFVSPPMPLDELLKDLNAVKSWAGRMGVYTNDSTGLHINISVPNYSLDRLDYVKLALLLGDEYVLNQFGRMTNIYTKSALGKVRDRVRQRPEEAQQLLDKMKGQMGELASKAIHDGSTDKYTSINTKSGHIEFRSPGGDWLDDNFDKIENTLLRFTVAMSAALNPEAYREEYQKKLYKLLTQDQKSSDTIQYFSDYVAGKIPKAALRSFVKQAQLERKVARDPTGGEKYWWRVGRPGYGGSVEVVATNPAEAIAAGKKEIPEWDYATDLTAKPIRPYSNKPIEPQQTYIINNGSYNTSSIKASSTEDAIRQFRDRISNESNPSTYSLILNNQVVATVSSGGDVTAVPTDNQGNWGVWVPSLDRWATVGNAGPRRFSVQAGADAWIQDYNTRNSGTDLELVAREIEPTAAPVNRNTLAPTGPGPWEVFRRSDGSSVAELGQANRMAAETEARGVIDQRREAPELYGVRTQQQADAAQGGIVDIEPDVAQNFAPQASTRPGQNQYTSTPIPGVQDVELDIPLAPQTLTRPGQGQQTFTGNWLVLDPQDREIYRFSGVGNNQSDANRAAMNWLRSNPGRMQAGVTVVPEMS